jgi:hypothetical protein
MCLSPHEMSTADVEREIAALYRWADEPGRFDYRATYLNRAERLEQMLKERANEGTL